MDAVARLHSQMAMLGRNVDNVGGGDVEGHKMTSLEEVNMNVNDFRPEVTAATAKLEDVFNFVLMEFTRSLQVQKDELTKAIDPLKHSVEKLHLKVDFLEKNDSKSSSQDLSKMVRNIMVTGVNASNFGTPNGGAEDDEDEEQPVEEEEEEEDEEEEEEEEDEEEEEEEPEAEQESKQEPEATEKAPEESGEGAAEADAFSIEEDAGGDQAAAPQAAAPAEGAAAVVSAPVPKAKPKKVAKKEAKKEAKKKTFKEQAKAKAKKQQSGGGGMPGLEIMQSFASLKQELTVLATTVQWMRQDIKNRRELQAAKDSQQDQVIKMELERLERVVEARMLSDAEFATEIERVKQQVSSQLQTQELQMTSMVTEAAKGLEHHMNKEISTVISQLAEMKEQATEQSRLQEEKIEQVQQEVLEWFREQQFEQQILAIQNDIKVVNGTLFEHGTQLELLEEGVTKNAFDITNLTAQLNGLERAVQQNKIELQTNIDREAKNTDTKIASVVAAMQKQQATIMSQFEKRDSSLANYKESVVRDREALEARQLEAREAQDEKVEKEFDRVAAEMKQEEGRVDGEFEKHVGVQDFATKHRAELEMRINELKEEQELQKKMAVNAEAMEELKDEMKVMKRQQKSAGEAIDKTRTDIKKVAAEGMTKADAQVLKDNVDDVKRGTIDLEKKVVAVQQESKENMELLQGEMESTKIIATNAKESAKDCAGKLYGLETDMTRKLADIDENLQEALGEKAKAQEANEGLQKVIAIVEKVETEIFELQESVSKDARESTHPLTACAHSHIRHELYLLLFSLPSG
jgi:hypothetical protein